MNIAFLAHDKKKELMVQFCTAYKSVLLKHSLYATATTGRLIADNTGLPITLGSLLTVIVDTFILHSSYLTHIIELLLSSSPFIQSGAQLI